MTCTPSRAFRRWCLATVALVLTWSMPSSQGYARVSPVNPIKFQLKKPNFLIVVESAETMQDIPGENGARYNEVGADCQNGDRFCRLYNQAGRCAFSGMGKDGNVSGNPGVVSTASAIGTATGTITTTYTQTGTVTGTAGGTSTQLTTATSTWDSKQLAIFHFDEGAGASSFAGQVFTGTSVAAATAYRWTATSTGTATSGISGAPNAQGVAYGKAVQLKGACLYLPALDNVQPKKLTVSMFVNRNASSAIQYILGQDYWTSAAQLNLRLSSGSLYYDANSAGSVLGPFSLSSGSWVHLAATGVFDLTSQTYVLYAGGNSLGTASKNTAYPSFNQGKWLLGCQEAGYPDYAANYFDGAIDEFKVYADQLDQTAIQALRDCNAAACKTSTQSSTGTVTVSTTNTGTAVATVSTGTLTALATKTATGTMTVSSTSFSSTTGYPDTDSCTWDADCQVGQGYCALNTTVPCGGDSTCSNLTVGDYCRFINSSSDGSGRWKNDYCSTDTRKYCKYQNIDCTTGGDAACTSASSPGDYCVAGIPAKMCKYAGLWCQSDVDCQQITGNSADACVPATSRMMMVKNALRRVILEYSFLNTAFGTATSTSTNTSPGAKFGLMHTFQQGDPTDQTKLFPYVKLQSTPAPASRTEEKFLPRSELLKGCSGTTVTSSCAPCYSESGGPVNTCTIDYGGNGAITNILLSGTPVYTVTYTLKSSANSRYGIPTGDGKRFYHVDFSWNSTCKGQCTATYTSTSTTTSTDQRGTAAYEGSYYTFSYLKGTPVTSGSGSLSQPVYFDTYRGKYYDDGAGNLYNLVDAERSEFVNANVYSAKPYTGSTWSPSAEYSPIPWSGATTTSTSTATSTSLDSTCSAKSGGLWDSKVVPFVNDNSFGGKPIDTVQKALMDVARLEKASFGGLYATGSLAPIGCALNNDGGTGASDEKHSAAHYMTLATQRDLGANGGGQPASNQPCWDNHVFLVVDGMPRGPKEDGSASGSGSDGYGCASNACLYDPTDDKKDGGVSDPSTSGCTCWPVLKAWALARQTTPPVMTHVIVAAPDLTKRNSSLADIHANPFWYAQRTLNNIARAGSPNRYFTNQPRYASTEDELYYWLRYEMKEALRMQFSTTQATAQSGNQTAGGVVAGNLLYTASVELPEWKGHLVAFDASNSANLLPRWDAAKLLETHPDSNDSSKTIEPWKDRKVYWSDGAGTVRKMAIDPTTLQVSDASALVTMGFGATTAEASLIARWALGDPALGNPAVLGGIVNSVPIDVGPPGKNPQPGAEHYRLANANRPHLVYVGADDGMLHAFIGAGSDVLLGTTTYKAGQEAFAFIPRDMLPVIAKLYAQGGQRYSPDEHVYGLASSPKVKEVCLGHCNVTTCSDDNSNWDPAKCPDWRTVLVMTEGPGGNKPFVLDLTGVATSSDISVPTPNNLVLWEGSQSDFSSSLSYLGETISVPGFFYDSTVTDKSGYRIAMTSGYPYPPGSASSTQGKYLLVANLDNTASPHIIKKLDVSATGTQSCPQAYAALSDVAVAKDYKATSDQGILGAYFGDTFGNLHQWSPGVGGEIDVASGFPIKMTCQQPIHFGPAVIQPNRLDTSYEQNIYLAFVTNSTLDPDTMLESASFTPSQLVVAKVDVDSGGLPAGLPNAFPAGGSDRKLVIPRSNICGTTQGMASTDSSCGAGGAWLPAGARPSSAPVAVLRSDGQGFQVLTTWYVPPKVNWDNCKTSATAGRSYIALHEFLANGTWTQLRGVEVVHQYVSGVSFLGSVPFITSTDSTTGTPTSIAGDLGQTFTQRVLQGQVAPGGRYLRTSWTERLDVQ